MGEYITPPGEEPLSSFGTLNHRTVSRLHLSRSPGGAEIYPPISAAKPTPSPAHYRPNTALTLPQSPRHSLHGRLYPLKSEWLSVECVALQ